MSIWRGLGLALAAAAFTALVACEGQGEGGPSPTETATIRPTTGTTPTPTLASTPTLTPAPTAEASPFALADLRRVWQAKGLTVTMGGPSAGFSGLAAQALDVRLARGADSMATAVLVYKDQETAGTDWQLVPGQAPVLKAGRTVPARVSTWWNENVIVVVLSGSPGIGGDALEAFLSLSP